MNLTGESKLFIGIFFISALFLVAAGFFFSRPAPTFSRAEMVGSAKHSKGSDQAAVYLVEFSDFQCPACKAAKPAVDSLTKKYGEKLLFVYRHFPLDSHPFGEKAARAAEAAGAQGKFWEMYELLFANQTSFSDTMFGELAKQLGLDETKFAADFAAAATRDLVAADRADGVRFGVNGTPTFFLNGQQVTLTSWDDLDRAVGQALPN